MAARPVIVGGGGKRDKMLIDGRSYPREWWKARTARKSKKGAK